MGAEQTFAPQLTWVCGRSVAIAGQQSNRACQVRAADMPGADGLMTRVYAAMAQKEQGPISERTKAALAFAKARGVRLGGDKGYSRKSGS